jgi:hypothetical protein
MWQLCLKDCKPSIDNGKKSASCESWATIFHHINKNAYFVVFFKNGTGHCHLQFCRVLPTSESAVPNTSANKYFHPKILLKLLTVSLRSCCFSISHSRKNQSLQILLLLTKIKKVMDAFSLFELDHDN